MLKSGNTKEHLIRPRINALLAQAVKNPLTIVCAGMGCGKTRAMYDFVQECKIPVAWLHFSPLDNISTRFWEIFVHATAQISKTFSLKMEELGFPDTVDKLNLYFDIRNHELPDIRKFLVYDDFHHIQDPTVLGFLESAFNNLPENVSLILISRELPQLNISRMMFKEQVVMIDEEALNFNESELRHYLLQQRLSAETSSLSQIYQDTKS
jgi:LuxR family maltose regulon positive regulatory protein